MVRLGPTAIALAALFALQVPVYAQSPAQPESGLIAIDYAMGTPADYLTTVEISNLERIEGFARTVASAAYVEPFTVPGQEGEYVGKTFRVLVDCAQNELREIQVANIFSTGGPVADFYEVEPRKLPADSAIFVAACGREGTLLQPFTLYNSEIRAAEEKRNVRFPGARQYPWPDALAAQQSFVRARAQKMARRENATVPYWAQFKPVPFVTVQTGFYPAKFRWEFYKMNNGQTRFDGAYVDLSSVVQLADDLYFYSLASIGVRATTARMLSPDKSNLGHSEMGMEVRCKPQVSERLSVVDYHWPQGEISSEALPLSALSWHPTSSSFAQMLCSGQFDANVPREPTLEAAVDRMHATLRATLGVQR